MFAWVIAGSLIVGAPGLKEVRKPVKPPEGEWWVGQKEEDGEVTHSNKERPREAAWATKFTSNKMILSVGGRPLTSRPAAYYQTDTDFEVDLYPDDPATLEKGIWKVDGDVLLVCYGGPGGDRPSDFTAPKGSGRTLWTLKRKPEK